MLTASASRCVSSATAGWSALGDGLVVAQLFQASREAFEQNNIIKSLARNDPRFTKITANHLPGFDPAGGWIPRIFNAGGEEVLPEAFNHERFRHMPEAYRTMKYAQLNHYCVRTLADFRAKKHRGTAANNDAKLHMNFFNLRNRNEVEDTTIQRYVPATKALMAEWLRDPVLAACNRRCFEAYEDILKKSETVFDR